MNIFGYEITIKKINNPLSGLKPKDVEKLAKTINGYERDGVARSIARIKAVRTLVPGTGLKDAKDWVDFHTF